jgi:DNA polymerase III delta prime subunit
MDSMIRMNRNKNPNNPVNTEINSIIGNLKKSIDEFENKVKTMTVNTGNSENLYGEYLNINKSLEIASKSLLATESANLPEMKQRFILLTAEFFDKIKKYADSFQKNGQGFTPGDIKSDYERLPKPLSNTELKQSIEKKIQNKIVSNPCGLRSFASYAGGEAYASRFTTAILNKYTFTKFAEDTSGADTFLLYGPPGTGKSLLAEAVAQQISEKDPRTIFYNISASDILGSFQGESEQSLQFLFEDARYRATQFLDKNNPNHVPVIIFIDEIDGLVTSGSGGQSSQSLLATFNAEFEGVGKDKSNKGLIVIAATNYPGRLPANVLSRFKTQMLVGLPLLSDYREIIMTKIVKYGFARNGLLFYDKDRKKIIEIDSQQDSNGRLENKEKTNLMSAFRIHDWETIADILNGTIDSNINKSDETIVNEIFSTLLNKSKDICKNITNIDEVDILAGCMYLMHYAPRQVDALFNDFILRMQSKTENFIKASNPPDSESLSQLWIYEKREVSEKKIQQGKCITNVIFKNSITPFAIFNEGNYESEAFPFRISRNKEGKIIGFDTVNGYGLLKSDFDENEIKFNVENDYILEIERKTIRNGGNRKEQNISSNSSSNSVKDILGGKSPLDFLKDKNKKELKEEIKEGELLQTESKKKALEKKETISYEWTIKTILKPGSIPLTKESLENVPENLELQKDKKFFKSDVLVPGISVNTKIDQETFLKMVTGSPMIISEFLPSFNSIRSVTIKNISAMIAFATTAGASIKPNQDDVEILKYLKPEMESREIAEKMEI